MAVAPFLVRNLPNKTQCTPASDCIFLIIHESAALCARGTAAADAAAATADAAYMRAACLAR
jgi:hypothetical protein